MSETTNGAPAALAGVPAAGLVDPAVLLGGALDALGLRLAGEARLEEDGFHGEFQGRLFGMECRGRLRGGTPWDPRGMRVEVRVEGDVPALSDAAGRLVRAGAERAAAELARLEALAAGGEPRERVEREAARLRDEATRRRDAADAAVRHAQQAADEIAARLAELDARLHQAHAAVAADRAHVDEGFRAAAAQLERQRGEVEAVQRELDAQTARYRGLDAAGQFSGAVAHGVRMSGLEAARLAAGAALDVAAAAVEAVGRARDAWRPEADLRVAAVLAERAGVEAARGAAAAALAAARGALHQLPDWVHDARLLAAEAARQVAAVDGAEAGRRLEEARGALGAAAALAQRLADPRARPVEVRALSFTTTLGAGAEPRVPARARIAVLRPDGSHAEEEVELALNAASPAEAAAVLAERVLGPAA